ncbi:HU family DNA-binding protein [Nitratidesulfovibrio vulgaris]|uniref:Histone family protein DNA-binding protein n=1 Tax=Nitratidesulfovibrio vulgaris (strain DP4) TaxID=391774 RepID=A0A0H3ADZ2_NITV4|nr:HU family DNA-binding protein [Nitratidesulfovibrio vulgaris]ABM30115.1 histone family protein DNA-binding protein [Nitratidesulfovibrio vulgaris DP4]
MEKTSKPQLVAYLRERAHLTEEQALMTLKALYLFSLEHLEKGVGVVLPDIGQIKPSMGKGGVGRNFRTGEATVIEPKLKLTFSASKALKEPLDAAQRKAAKQRDAKSQDGTTGDGRA